MHIVELNTESGELLCSVEFSAAEFSAIDQVSKVEGVAVEEWIRRRLLEFSQVYRWN